MEIEEAEKLTAFLQLTEFKEVDGEILDLLASQYGLKRNTRFWFWKESDEAFKKRILTYMREGGYYVSQISR